MRKVLMRVTQKEASGKEVTDYLETAINEANVNVVMPSGMEGIVLLLMSNEKQHLIKGSVKDWVKK